MPISATQLTHINHRVQRCVTAVLHGYNPASGRRVGRAAKQSSNLVRGILRGVTPLLIKISQDVTDFITLRY